jgi:ribonuclease-3
MPPDTVVIFRTRSDVEAAVVRGLLETHGIDAMVSSDVPRAIFPLSVAAVGEVRVSVYSEDADDARQLIESHRDTSPSGPAQVLPWRDALSRLEDRLGYRFHRRPLLEQALTHRSRAHEDPNGETVDNESLEFLGDAVLGFVVAAALYERFPEFDEGQKSKAKASIVSAQSLARIADHLALGDHLLLGRGEEKTGGRHKHALLADACEALFAAVYLDGGIEPARALILREMASAVDALRQPGRLTALTGDFKSALQERLQSEQLPLPRYRIVKEEGPDHDKRFEIEVWSEQRLLASGEGRSKKDAEQQAARLALQTLDEHAPASGGAGGGVVDADVPVEPPQP